MAATATKKGARKRQRGTKTQEDHLVPTKAARLLGDREEEEEEEEEGGEEVPDVPLPPPPSPLPEKNELFWQQVTEAAQRLGAELAAKADPATSFWMDVDAEKMFAAFQDVDDLVVRLLNDERLTKVAFEVAGNFWTEWEEVCNKDIHVAIPFSDAKTAWKDFRQSNHSHEEWGHLLRTLKQKVRLLRKPLYVSWRSFEARLVLWELGPVEVRDCVEAALETYSSKTVPDKECPRLPEEVPAVLRDLHQGTEPSSDTQIVLRNTLEGAVFATSARLYELTRQLAALELEVSRGFGKLPAHDTVGFLLDMVTETPAEVQRCFALWMREKPSAVQQDLELVDPKTWTVEADWTVASESGEETSDE